MSEALKPSPEIEAVARRWFEATGRHDYATLKTALSTSEQVRFVGTSLGEIWQGPSVREGIPGHYEEIPHVLARRELLLEAFECGKIGWVFSLQSFDFAGLPEPVEFRVTLVFALEDGAWRIIHRHTSIAQVNSEIFGYEPKAINTLIEAARDGFRLDQTSGLATVMFTDVVGSTQLAELIGDVAWTTRIKDHLDVVGEIISGHGGQLVKSLGDGTLSSFTSARSAMRAAKYIQAANGADISEPNLQLRVGLHTGDVIQTQDDFFGRVVNKAARLVSAATPGEIILSDATSSMVGGDISGGTDNGAEFIVGNRRDIGLKGIDGTHRIMRLMWP